jgi:hypothetical protein
VYSDPFFNEMMGLKHSAMLTIQQQAHDSATNVATDYAEEEEGNANAAGSAAAAAAATTSSTECNAKIFGASTVGTVFDFVCTGDHPKVMDLLQRDHLPCVRAGSETMPNANANGVHAGSGGADAGASISTSATARGSTSSNPKSNGDLDIDSAAEVCRVDVQGSGGRIFAVDVTVKRVGEFIFWHQRRV